IDVFIDFDWGATKYIEKLPVKKSIVWIHNSVPKLLGEKTNKIERFGKRLAKYDRVVAICEDMKDEIEKIYPYLKGKVSRVYNPFNFMRIEKLGENESQLIKEQKELLKERYCIAVSRLDTVQKDYDTLLKAFGDVKEKIGNLKLYIVGDGPDRNKIEDMVSKYGLGNYVKLLGLQKNPYIWMKKSQFFVHSSKYEGLPTVLIEAMILNKPVISSDCPTGPREILEDGESGILYPVGDWQKLALYIEELAVHEKRREEILEKSIKRKRDFHTSVVIKEYEKIIDGL
ncbi:MAG: glycosyltransferase, partial [Fusobacteriaceae bacterium]